MASNRDSYSSTYYQNGLNRDSPPLQSPQQQSSQQQSSCSRRSPSMSRIPRVSSSLDDLRSEFNRISDESNLKNLNLEDLTWDRMGAKVQDMLEQKANEPVIGADGKLFFPPPPRRKRRREDMPLIINGNIVPRKDALLIDLVLNNKTTLESQLSLTKHPIVGLDYVVEYIDPDNESPRVYHCKLCKQFNTCATVMEHISGYNHRVRYIASKYPNQAKTYLLPDGRHTNRNVALIKMAQGRAQELELVYGRGEHEVRYERPTIPQDAQLDKESDVINVESGKQTEVLKNALQMIRSCKLELDEDIRVAKQIINDLTDAIIEYKQSSDQRRSSDGNNY